MLHFIYADINMVVLIVPVLLLATVFHGAYSEHEYINEFVVELNGDVGIATSVAEAHGFDIKANVSL